MRFHSIALCTLTVLLAGGLAAQASENQTPEGSPEQPATPNVSPATPTVTPSKIAPIAAPEILGEQQFIQSAAINPSSESFTQPTVSNQKAQSQNPEVELSMAEAPQPGSNVTALSTPDANQLASNPSPLASLSNAQALRANEIVPQSSTANTRQLVADAATGTSGTCIAQALPTEAGSTQLAQGTVRRCPRPQPIAPIAVPELPEEYGASPGLSIYIPVGFGADRNTLFLNGDYQATLREDDGSVGGGGIGIGLGNAEKAVGLELSYALENGENTNFADGGLNAKLHRRFGQDSAGAIGWNGILNSGRNDFEHSKYGVLTHVFRTQDSLNDPFSRVAVTVGVGDGQFRSNGAVDAGDNNINVFGNVAIRVVRPVSFITEWTGQDLALGLSIAPFKNIPFVITPAVRDVAGAGDGARFVIGAGTALRF